MQFQHNNQRFDPWLCAFECRQKGYKKIQGSS